MSRYRRMVLGSVAIAALALAVVAYAQRGEGQGGPGEGPGAGMMGRMAMAGPTATMAVGEGAVFILAGRQLYKYSADTLELQAQVQLPRPENPDRPGPPNAP